MTAVKLGWEKEKIIDVANEFLSEGSSPASTGEKIAAAFVLNDPRFLPDAFPDMVEAWDHLGEAWQTHVREIKSVYMHLISKSAPVRGHRPYLVEPDKQS